MVTDGWQPMSAGVMWFFRPILSCLQKASERKKKDLLPQQQFWKWQTVFLSGGRFKIINITARVNVYCHKISQVEDKASRDGIRKREDDDDGGEDEVGEENQTLADFPESLRFLIGGRGSLGQMVDRDEEEEHDKWENQAKDQPHIDQLYVGGRGDLVGDRLVESVDDEHHGDADGGRGLEVLGPEVETTLADEHKAEGGKVGGQKVVLHAAFENQRHLNPRLSLCHLPVEQGKLCGKKHKI